MELYKDLSKALAGETEATNNTDRSAFTTAAPPPLTDRESKRRSRLVAAYDTEDCKEIFVDPTQREEHENVYK